MSKCFRPGKGERREHRGASSGFGEARTPLRCPAVPQTLVEAQPPSEGGRSLAQHSQRGSALRGHLGCPAPSTSAAPHPSFPASSTTKAAHCCLVWCRLDMSSSKTHTGVQRRAGMIIPLGHFEEALLQGPPPPAAPPVAVDAPLPGKPLVQPVKNVT